MTTAINTHEIKREIQHNAIKIEMMRESIHSTFLSKNNSKAHQVQWENACQSFHAKYDLLSFPGGYSVAFDNMAQGDSFTIEAALCFVELRPYFFRSGYMFRALIPKLKKASLSDAQKKRFDLFLEKYEHWKQHLKE